jgi:hypothetical protein
MIFKYNRKNLLRGKRIIATGNNTVAWPDRDIRRASLLFKIDTILNRIKYKKYIFVFDKSFFCG